MIAQAGLDQLVGPLLSPFIMVWLMAAGLLLAFASFGLFVFLIRAWNRWSDR